MAALIVLLLPLLSGCETRSDRINCPVTNILANTASMTVFKPNMQGDPAGMLYSVRMTGLRKSCDFDKDEGTADSDITINFQATRPPSGVAAHYEVPYYVVSTLNGNTILTKQILAVPLDFAPGEASTTFSANVSSLVLHYANGHKPYEYGILVGIQLTREQLDYNSKTDAAP